MIIFTGYQQKKGSYPDKETGELREYDNIELSYICNDKLEVKGFYADTAKAKTDQLKLVGAKNLDELIGKEVYLIVDITAKTDDRNKASMNVANVVLVDNKQWFSKEMCDMLMEVAA